MNNNDDQCCTKCGETDDLIEYHMAGWEVNADYQPTPLHGGMDYPTEYIWCGNCDAETSLELFENWHERTTNEQ